MAQWEQLFIMTDKNLKKCKGKDFVLVVFVREKEKELIHAMH